jgi:hypothetical protein
MECGVGWEKSVMGLYPVRKRMGCVRNGVRCRLGKSVMGLYTVGKVCQQTKWGEIKQGRDLYVESIIGKIVDRAEDKGELLE